MSFNLVDLRDAIAGGAAGVRASGPVTNSRPAGDECPDPLFALYPPRERAEASFGILGLARRPYCSCTFAGCVDGSKRHHRRAVTIS